MHIKKAIFGLITILFFYACNTSDEGNQTTEQEFQLLELAAASSPNTATWIPRDEIKSRNGESMGYGVFLNPSSTKLIIFLDGGGACFNGITCALNLDSYTEEDFFNRVASENALIINRDSAENQFKDWNFVFVPYATGDVHSSSRFNVDVPGGPTNQTMTGFSNFTVILEDLKRYFDANGGLTEIVFSGSSAGGFGTLANTLQLKEILAVDTPTTVIVDAGQILMNETLLTPCLADKWESLWQFSDFLPDDLDETVQKTYAYDIQKTYEYLSIKLPDFNFGFLSHYEDNTNRSFYSFGQNNCSYPPISFTPSISGEAFKNGLIDLKTTILDDFDNWKVFYANGSSHTFLGDVNLNQTIDNTSLNDWILQLRQGNAVDLMD